MTSIKVKFRPSTVAGRDGRIYYQILHDRRPRQLLTNYHIASDEWDADRESVIVTAGSDRKDYLMDISRAITRDMYRLRMIVKKFEMDDVDYSSGDVIERFRKITREYTVFRFMERIIERLRRQDRIRTSETYTSALRSFTLFRKGKDIGLDTLSADVMEDYEAWLQSRGVVPNTVSFYTRILRAVYNRAVEEGMTTDHNPFRHVYTGIDKTSKRALPLTTIKLIRELDLSSRPVLDHARDIFILSFMLRGMSFIDMAMLRKSDCRDGQIIYRRRKTGQRIAIRWTRDMQRILDKYPSNESDYLLPIIRRPDMDARHVYHSISSRINHNLKHIAGMVGIRVPLTMYVARHSWASAAQAKGIPLGIISEGMGHSSESTTRIYLAGLESSSVDNANDIILRSIR